MRPKSGFQIALNWPQIGKGQWLHDLLIWHHCHVFLHCFVSLLKFSYWSKFHANIITGSGVMTIYFYKGFTRYPKIGNTNVCVLPNIWRLRRVRDTSFGTDVSNKMLLNAAKCQSYSFYLFWVVQRKTKGGGGIIPPPHSLKFILKISFLRHK